jgi:hypothetical protein
MIYQCYPFVQDSIKLFPNEPYRGFGLEPESNKLLSLNCPELEDPATRLQLTEYACLLWHWRNPGYDTDFWIGTTSIRQLNKFAHVFKTKQEVRDLVNRHSVVAWGEYAMVTPHPEDQSINDPITLAQSTEICHPGLNRFMSQALGEFDYSIPAEWFRSTSGFFANYWVMNKEQFEDFMSFSWPIVEWSLENVKGTPFYKNHHEGVTLTQNKAVAYFAERLFLIWYMLRGITPYNPSTPSVLTHGLREIKQ